MSSAQTSQASDAAPSAPRKVDALLAHYGQSDRNPRNELIQYIAIPLIMFSLIGTVFFLNPVVAYGFMAASLVYYACLSWVFFAVMLGRSLASTLLLFALGECFAACQRRGVRGRLGHAVCGPQNRGQ